MCDIRGRREGWIWRVYGWEEMWPSCYKKGCRVSRRPESLFQALCMRERTGEKESWAPLIIPNTCVGAEVCLGHTAGEGNPVSQAEVTPKVPSVPRHCQQDPYHTLILDYDREPPQCHTDNSKVFAPLSERRGKAGGTRRRSPAARGRSGERGALTALLRVRSPASP